MNRYFAASVGLFALLILPTTSSAQAVEAASQTDGANIDESGQLSDSGKRLSSQEVRRHISSLERGAVDQREQIAVLQQSLDSIQAELQQLRAQHQQYVSDTEAAMTSGQNERLESEKAIQSRIGTLAEKLSSENADRLASQVALGNEVNLIAKQATDSEQKLANIAQDVTRNSDSLSLLENRVTRSESDLSEQGKLLDSKFVDVSDAVSMQTIVGGTTAALLGLVVFVLARRVVLNRRQLANQISDSSKSLRNDYDDLDLKISELLEQQLGLLSANENSDSPAGEPDHSLPLQVAAEVHRMSKRLDNMPAGTKGVQPLTKALERLIDGLEANGYEMVSLLGMKYDEGMTIKASFTLDDDLSPGDQIISRIIKPQVNYKGALVQVADVEVSFGE